MAPNKGVKTIREKWGIMDEKNRNFSKSRPEIPGNLIFSPLYKNCLIVHLQG